MGVISGKSPLGRAERGVVCLFTFPPLACSNLLVIAFFWVEFQSQFLAVRQPGGWKPVLEWGVGREKELKLLMTSRSHFSPGPLLSGLVSYEREMLLHNASIPPQLYIAKLNPN